MAITVPKLGMHPSEQVAYCITTGVPEIHLDMKTKIMSNAKHKLSSQWGLPISMEYNNHNKCHTSIKFYI